jgi:hypothetical protein
VPRPRSWTDDDLRAAVAQCKNLYQVSKMLGIIPGKRTYALLRRHIARLGIPADHLPPVERSQRLRRTWTDDDLRAVVAASMTLSQVLRALGYKPSGGMHRLVAKKIVNLGIDTSHFLGRSWNRGQRRPSPSRIPLQQILVRNSTYTNTARLRRRLVAEGLKPAHCERCELDSWLGEPLPLALDHVNGDHADNRLENLRILCPNCHALTETWCGRKGNYKPA